MAQELFVNFFKKGLANKAVIYCSQRLAFSNLFSHYLILDEGTVLAQGKQADFKKNLEKLFENTQDLDLPTLELSTTKSHSLDMISMITVSLLYLLHA